MRRVKLLALLVAFLAIPSALNAQGVPFMSGGIGFFGGLAMPTGDFSDDEGTDAGAATMGFMVGADAYLPLGTTPFTWITSASINSVGVDAEDVFGPEADLGRYWLVPVMTGAGYQIAMGPGMSLTPMAQIGFNFTMGPNGEIGDEEVEVDNAFSLAFSAGANFMFSESLGATARYVNAGGPEREVDAGAAGEGEIEPSQTFLQLGVVYRFR